MDRIAKIYYQVKGMYDKINPGQFIRSFSRIRVRSSIDNFIVEEIKVKGSINFEGIQSPGLTSSPAIAEMVIHILKGTGLKLESNASFDPYRKPIITKKALNPLKE